MTPVHPETGKVSPHTIPVPLNEDGSASDWAKWGTSFKAAIVASTTSAEMEEWVRLNAAATGQLSIASVRLHSIVLSIITQLRSKLSAPPAEENHDALEIPAFMDKRPPEKAA